MPTDEWLIEFMKQRPEVKMLWLLNKCDQIKTQERRTTLRAVEKRAAEFGDRVTVQFFSGLKREGVDELAKTPEPGNYGNAANSGSCKAIIIFLLPIRGPTDFLPSQGHLKCRLLVPIRWCACAACAMTISPVA